MSPADDGVRAEILRLLERAAAALIDAEEHGPEWSGRLAALDRAATLKARADALEARLVLARSWPSGGPAEESDDAVKP